MDNLFVTVLIVVAGVVVGAALGSFAACAFYRAPRGISLITPRSACPDCGHTLTTKELIPVVSFIIQKGHARCCNARLSPLYIVHEVLFAWAGGTIAYAYFV